MGLFPPTLDRVNPREEFFASCLFAAWSSPPPSFFSGPPPPPKFSLGISFHKRSPGPKVVRPSIQPPLPPVFPRAPWISPFVVPCFQPSPSRFSWFSLLFPFGLLLSLNQPDLRKKKVPLGESVVFFFFLSRTPPLFVHSFPPCSPPVRIESMFFPCAL